MYAATNRESLNSTARTVLTGEYYSRLLLQSLYDFPIKVTAFGEVKEFSSSRAWHYFSRTNGDEFALAFNFIDEANPESRLMFHLRGLAMAQALPFLVESVKRTNELTLELPLEVYSLNGESLLGRAYFACAGRVKEEPSFKAPNLKSRCYLGLSLENTEELMSGDQVPVIGAKIFFSDGFLESATSQWLGELRSVRGRIAIEIIRRLTMEELFEQKVGVSLSLGAVELTMADILSLRPGTVIQIAKETTLPVYLNMADSPWAEGEITVAEKEISIRLTKIWANQETSAEKLR